MRKSSSAFTQAQQAHLAGVPAESREDMARYLASNSKVFVYMQDEARPDVPPWAISVLERPEFWIDCKATQKQAVAYAKTLGLVVVARPNAHRPLGHDSWQPAR